MRAWSTFPFHSNSQYKRTFMTDNALNGRGLEPSLTVNDVEQSVRFYRDGLGFTVVDEMKDDSGKVVGARFKAGAARLGLSQDDFSKGRDRLKGVGVRLWIETDQDLEALAKRAKDSGITLDNGPAPLPWGPVAFAITDPDGYKLTITAPE